jgi:uncharacterized protein
MSRRIIEAFLPKVIDHCKKHGLDYIHLTLHGGEPLLQPKEDYLWMMERFDEIDQAGIRTLRKCTTNAVLLNDEWAELLARFNVSLGVSIDGVKQVHDAARVDLSGRGTYDRVVRGLRTALKWQDKGLRVGTISVLNPTMSGRETYHHLRSLGVSRINILLPEANYAQPLPVISSERSYGQLLTEFFDAWVEEDDPSVYVSLLTEVVRAVSGLPSISDAFGYAPVRVAVLETNGSLQPTDNFRACADGMSELGLNVFRHQIDDLYDHEFFQLCINQQRFVPEECRDCQFVKICGGGRITSRYSKEYGFSRKSIHCDALYTIFDHARKTLASKHLISNAATAETDLESTIGDA